ncbi:MAG TPA: DNA-processing protein DprA [Pyrinomonadaceae bacterium]|nr:DNA-protecting protein DprA [Chloracidobacterium sp.]MBP9934957.1 DNA-processing protein DprA [Pyrinomonadaceae bacterium]MBK7801415.1 DNA-protecting protein DprA [Chloracidobacterium sp.]MBK9436735.1 DNA-protecting protein DprA [Chloracidobacterium sp.]MBL0241725.1 DNA-protecting protein DprA [Chloracidobacterium sp.]
MKEWIALNMTPGVGPRAATKLLERFGSPGAVFHARRTELESLRIKPETIDSLIKRELEARAEQELERVKALDGDILILDDGSYPALLREIDDPPIVLYVKGDWQGCFDRPCVGVIGSRTCSTYGENASEMLARDLASRGITIVSGLARGIDTAAHRGAIRGNGKTVAVIGTGIDSVYPRENTGLVREILASGGCIVSQFPLGTPPLKENFPYRNRIISGLSYGVLIVEASERSGSLITARLAMEQNREVMAVPGNITSGNSFGTNYLIKSGAKLVQQWQDVVSELPSEIAATILPPKIKKAKAEEAVRQPELIPADMSENERAIWTLLTADEGTHIDILLESSKLSFGDLNTALVAMDIRDLIRVLPGKHYARRI